MFPKKLILIWKNKIKGKSKCAIWLIEKTFVDEIEEKYGLESELVKEQEAKILLSNLGIRIPLS